MTPLPNDSHLTPDQRRREIATILAKAILRLRQAARSAPDSANSDPAQHAPEADQKGLELSSPSRTHVTRG